MPAYVGRGGPVALGSASTSYSLATSSAFPIINEAAGGGAGPTLSTAMTTGTVGDIVVCYAHDGFTASQSVTSVTDTASAITWQSSPTVSCTNTGNQFLQMWYGIVKAGKGNTATNVVIHWGVTSSDPFCYLWEFNTSDGGTWSILTSGQIYDEATGSGTICPYPSLATSSSQGGIYLAANYLNQNTTSTSSSNWTNTGIYSGFVGQPTTNFNFTLYGCNLAPSTTYAPTCTQSPADHLGDSLAMIMVST